MKKLFQREWVSCLVDALLPVFATIIALVWGSRAATRKRLGSPAALGTPYIRGERGL